MLKFIQLWCILGLCSLALQAQPLNDPFADDLGLSASAPQGGLSPNDLPNYQEWSKKAPAATLSIITADELHDWMQKGNKRFYLLDVRDQDEFDVSHIKDARRIGSADFNVERVWMFHRNAPVIVYCTNGERSQTMAQYLGLMGFEDVRILDGQLLAWWEKHRSLVNKDNQASKEILMPDKTGKKILKKLK
jgi:rhodanese-related sulfurtransferase